MRRLMPARETAPAAVPALPATGGAGVTLDEMEREHILAVLKHNEGNRTAAAAALGISRRTLYYKLEEYQRQGYAVK